MVELAKEYGKSEHEAHRLSHFGTKAGVLPLFVNMDWSNIKPCVLHLYTNITVKLIDVVILPLLVDREQTALELAEFLTKFGVRFAYVPLTAQEDKTPHYNNIAKHGWIGRHCDIVIEKRVEIFEMLYAGLKDKSGKAAAIKLLETFETAYHAVTHIDDDAELEPQVRDMEAHTANV